MYEHEREVQELNQRFLQALTTPGMEKVAQDEVTEFTRTYVLEMGFKRKILPPIPISPDKLDRRSDTDKPYVVVDKEPGMPPAISVPLGTLPTGFYIRGPRYEVKFQRILSPKFYKDIGELATYRMDIRQVLADKIVKVIQFEEDSKFLKAVDSILVAPNTNVPRVGVPLWRQFVGGLSRVNWVESTKIMASTKFHLEPSCMLLNTLTYREFLKWGRDEWGGDVAAEIIRTGNVIESIDNIKLILTIKHELVPTNTIYYFAEPRFLGKFFVVDDITMYVKNTAYIIEFWAYEFIGSAIGHGAALARADFV
jgi:hypothetical protein